jgi:hypothetical protein
MLEHSMKITTKDLEKIVARVVQSELRQERKENLTEGLPTRVDSRLAADMTSDVPDNPEILDLTHDMAYEFIHPKVMTKFERKVAEIVNRQGIGGVGAGFDIGELHDFDEQVLEDLELELHAEISDALHRYAKGIVSLAETLIGGADDFEE